MSRLNSTRARELTPQQTRALETLLAGGGVQDAAAVADVHRCTIHAWLTDTNSTPFATEYERGCRELRESATLRVRALIESAVAVVADEIRGGNLTAALAVLKGTGMFTTETHTRLTTEQSGIVVYVPDNGRNPEPTFEQARRAAAELTDADGNPLVYDDAGRPLVEALEDSET